MIRRPTLILLGILAAGVALAWWLEGSPAAAWSDVTPSATEAARLLPGLDTRSLKRIAVTGPTGQNIALVVSAQNQYTLEGQPDLVVDPGAAVQLISELAAIRLTQTVQSTTGAESLGLAAPHATIAVESTSGSKHTVKIGTETPIQDGYYVQVDTNSPAVVGIEGIDRVLSLSTVDALSAAEPAATHSP